MISKEKTIPNCVLITNLDEKLSSATYVTGMENRVEKSAPEIYNS